MDLNTISESNKAKFKVLKKLHIQHTRRNHHISYLTRCGNLAVTRSNKEPKSWILLCFLLTKTCFKFNDHVYEQISGTTMGTKCAPSYSLIIMDKFDRSSSLRYTLSPMVWWWYIDEIFMIWSYSRKELYSFIKVQMTKIYISVVLLQL